MPRLTRLLRALSNLTDTFFCWLVKFLSDFRDKHRFSRKFIKDGTSRICLLVGPFALKIAKGKYHRETNANEHRIYQVFRSPYLCPVYCCLFGGWLSVMKRVELLPEKTFYAKNTEVGKGWITYFCEHLEDVCELDIHHENVGFFTDPKTSEKRFVLIDYERR